MLNRYLLSYSNFNKGCWQSVLLTLIESMATGICFFLSIYFVSYLQLSIAISGFLISAYGVGTICGGELWEENYLITFPQKKFLF